MASSPSSAELPALDDVFVRCSQLKKESVQWLWPGRVPLGKLTLLVGDPGQGKSFLTLDLAARVTRGNDFPHVGGESLPRPACQEASLSAKGFASHRNEKSNHPPGTVIILNAEDNHEDTVLPRLAEAGADLERCILLKKTRGKDGVPFSLALERDIELLRRVIEQNPDCRLVVIDPISAYLGDADGHNNQQVRTLFLPLVELAAERNVAVVMVSHLNKRAGSRAMHRTMGSMAFLALARSAWLISADPENSRRRLMPSLKSNLRDPLPGLAFELAASDPAGVAHIEWSDEPVAKTLAEVIEPKERAVTLEHQKYQDETSYAVIWLREHLQNGPVKRDSLVGVGSPYGAPSRGQLYRAAEKLGVVMQKFGITWDDNYWLLPEHIDQIAVIREELTREKEEQARQLAEYERKQKARREAKRQQREADQRHVRSQ